VCRALNVPVSSADAEAERALNSYRPITNWCVRADSLSEESVKELCSAAWNRDLYADLKATTQSGTALSATEQHLSW